MSSAPPPDLRRSTATAPSPNYMPARGTQAPSPGPRRPAVPAVQGPGLVLGQPVGGRHKRRRTRTRRTRKVKSLTKKRRM